MDITKAKQLVVNECALSLSKISDEDSEVLIQEILKLKKFFL